jgi:hypothetical protein
VLPTVVAVAALVPQPGAGGAIGDRGHPVVTGEPVITHPDGLSVLEPITVLQPLPRPSARAPSAASSDSATANVGRPSKLRARAASRLKP